MRVALGIGFWGTVALLIAAEAVYATDTVVGSMLFIGATALGIVTFFAAIICGTSDTKAS